LPQLCKDPDAPAIGACRTCLVAIEGVNGFPAACSTPARDGMALRTDAPSVERIRRAVLELTLAMHPEDCQGHGYSGRCQLMEAAERYSLRRPRWVPKVRRQRDDSSPFFTLDMSQCILCARCVAACDQVQSIGAIALLGRGHGSFIGTFDDRPIAQSICTSCGQCVATCPTGAFEAKRPAGNVVREVESTCPYCGVGCGVILQVDDQDRIAAVQDDPANLSSQGVLCVKGRFGTRFVHHPERLTTPLIRHNGRLLPATWDEAREYVAERFVQYRGAFAAVASAKATNEDGYVLQKFARLVMGSNNIDHCTRLCHSPSVAAMLVALGSGATSNSYTDYERAGCLLIVGADPGSNHPVIAVRFRRAVEKGARLIAINPKRIDLCDYADLWLRPRPGTDVALLNGMANVILSEGLWDRDFVADRSEGFQEWRAVVERYTPESVEEMTGVPADDIRQAARMYARPPFSGSCLIWGMGITQHTMGTANSFALLNLALVAGQMGKPGSGISPLRGQNNVQGCGDAGCIPDNLPGYQPITPEVTGRFGQAWGGTLPLERGLAITEMVEAALQGELKCMYIVGENLMVTEPDIAHARQALERLEFLVVQELFPQETTELAHVVLPACSFAEKDGTFTNSERRVQRVRRAIPPVGESRPDWEIVCDLARRACRRLGLPEEAFRYDHPSQIFDEMVRLTPIIAGISYQRLEMEGGIQWPCPTQGHPGTPMLYEQEFPRGPLARFVPVEQGAPAAELPDEEYPLILNTGRLLYHWHAGTLTRRVDELLAKAPELQLALNPADARRYGLADGDLIAVVSRRQQVVARALVTDAVRQGEVFAPFVRLRESAINFLTNAVYDPESKIPEYKVCAVRIARVG
ncbi:MAG: formate dehydrogenase subunit alpha, partial [Dehalococcoidia bacterium]